MMVIMWFSGLRGAIAYALSLHLEFEEDVRKVIVTTTLVVVLFTTICLGKDFTNTLASYAIGGILRNLVGARETLMLILTVQQKSN